MEISKNAKMLLFASEMPCIIGEACNVVSVAYQSQFSVGRVRISWGMSSVPPSSVNLSSLSVKQEREQLNERNPFKLVFN